MASPAAERSVRTGRRASLTIASMERWSTPMCSTEPLGELLVRRPPRRPGAARSRACGAGGRGRRPRPARRRGARRCGRPGRSGPGPARGSRAGRPPRPGRARSPSRSWCAVPATCRTGSLTRRPSREAITSASASSTTPRPMMPAQAPATPRCRSAGVTLLRTTAVPFSSTTGSSTRPPVAVDDPEALAAGGAAYLRVLAASRCRSRSPACRRSARSSTACRGGPGR